MEKIPQLREMKSSSPCSNACLTEGTTLHHVVGMPLVRVVPKGRVKLERKWLPAGVSPKVMLLKIIMLVTKQTMVGIKPCALYKANLYMAKT